MGAVVHSWKVTAAAVWNALLHDKQEQRISSLGNIEFHHIH